MPNEKIENQIIILSVPKDDSLPIEATVSGGVLLEKFETHAADDRSGIKKISSATGTHSVFAIDRNVLEVRVRRKEEPQPKPISKIPLVVYPITGDDAIVDTTDHELARKLMGDYTPTKEKKKCWTLIGIDGRGGYQTRWRLKGHRLLLKAFSLRLETSIALEMAKEK